MAPEVLVLVIGFGIVLGVLIIFFINEAIQESNEQRAHEIRSSYNQYLLQTARKNEARKRELNKDPLLKLCEKYVGEAEC